MAKQTKTDKGEVDWFGEEVLLQLGNIAREGVEAIAHEITAQAVVNITNNNQVDTGFMRNTVYVATREDSTFNETDGDGLYVNKLGQQVERNMAPEQPLPAEYDALVCVGADYAIFQELEKPFLYPALLAAQAAAGGILKQKAKENGVD